MQRSKTMTFGSCFHSNCFNESTAIFRLENAKLFAPNGRARLQRVPLSSRTRLRKNFRDLTEKHFERSLSPKNIENRLTNHPKPRILSVHLSDTMDQKAVCTVFFFFVMEIICISIRMFSFHFLRKAFIFFLKINYPSAKIFFML